MNILWWKAALIRAAKTMAQTAVAQIGAGAVGILDVNWISVVSVSLMAGILSVLTSIAGLPEVEIETSDFEKALKEAGVETLDSEDLPDGIGTGFTPRLSAPSASDKNWLHTSKGGYNSCILISGKSCLPNCVGYAWGRWRELLGKAPALSRSNAENWWSYGDGYKRGQEPKVGAVACWRKGKAGVASDGAGHVAIVEKIEGNVITLSNSAYGGTRFYLTKMKKGNMSLGGTYAFQGFIYLPDSVDTSTGSKTSTQTAKKTTYKVVEKSGMNIRATAKSSGKKIGTIAYGKTFQSSKKSGDWAYYDDKKGWVCIKEGKSIYLKAQ